jgi:hypothetical protein
MVPDYYARLGVDPGATTAEIEAALLKQQPIWSMGTRNPKTRHTNQLYLDEIPALRRSLLAGPESRAAYDAELAAAQIAEREQKLDELRRRIRLRAAKGGLSPADRALLRDEVARLGLDQGLLDRLTRLIPVLVEVAETRGVDDVDAEPPADVLDPSTRRQIRGALEHLGRRDLYDALGLFRDAPTSVIAARADEERQRWMRKAQVTAEKTAWLEIISHAQSHLTSAKARARYDRTLTLEAEEQFEAVTAFALKGLTRLDSGTHATLIDEAAALGIGADRADRLIGRSCRKAGVAREIGPVAALGSLAAGGVPPAVGGGASPSANGAYQQLRCRNCSGVTELSPVMRRTSPARCRHCGASLKWDCPVCRRSHWVDEPRCACGFLLSLREPLVQHFAAAQHAFRVHDMASARAHLEAVQKFAPHHVGARNGLAKIRQHEADVEAAKMAYELAVADKKLVAARQALETWRKLVDPSSPEVQSAWKEVITGLRQAVQLAALARKLERTDPPAARGLYRKALEIATDLPDALAGLGRCPPDAPTALDVHALGDRIRLTWTPPPPDGLGPLTFAVVRKRGGLPQHPGDGTRIAEVSTCEFEDRRVRPGETVSYAVLARRGEAESLSAVAAGPVAFLPDVQDVRVEPREGVVELSWIPPHGAFEIRVIRRRGAPPSGPRDGDRVGASLDQALDIDLQNDQVYHYGIYAIYRQADGRRFPSPGVLVAAIPRSPVAPLNPPRLMLTPGGQVRLDWIEPQRGAVRILRTPRPLPYSPGTQLTLAEAEQVGGDWISILGPDRAEDSAPPGGGLCVYTPLLATGGNLIVGSGASLSRVADPSDLRATRVGGSGNEVPRGPRIQFRWRWPREATLTRLVIRQGKPPSGPDDPEAIVVDVTCEEYDRMGAWAVSLPRPELDEPSDFELEPAGGAEAARLPAGRWHATAYSVVAVEGGSLLSPGLDPTATIAIPGPDPEVTLSYALKRPWMPGRRWSLSVHTEPAGAAVPPLVLVANPRAIPLSADDGEVVARWPASKDGATHLIRTELDLSRSGVRAFLDPTADPGSLPPIRIRHPESGLTRA